MQVVHDHLAVLYIGKAFAQADRAGADALDLGPVQSQARLDFIEDVVVEMRLAVLGDDLDARRRG